jgi:hypothetical protein
MTGNETSAVASLKAMAVAQVGYSTTCGRGGYAPTLTVLATAPGGVGEGYIDMSLGQSDTPLKSGYNFTLTAGSGAGAGPNDCNGSATVTAFYATAIPLTYGTTGRRSFAVNQSNTVYEIFGPAAPTEPFGAPATPVQ